MPLNSFLYQKADRLPGGVRRVCKEGEQAVTQQITDLRTGRQRTYRISGGEEYQCRCPFCDDQSNHGHLYINYMYGVYDDYTGSNNQHLATCFRRNCLSNPENREKLFDLLFGKFANDRSLKSIKVQSNISSPVETLRLTLVKPPGIVIPLSSLPDDYSVIKYLTNRGYDIKELNNVWKIGYCVEPCDRLAEGRIYVPINMDNILVGWQARWPDDCDWKATGIKKYHNLPRMPKRLMLYNYDIARQYQKIVVVEGCSDVWAVGPQAVSLLGKTASVQQKELLIKNWGNGVIIICLDSNDPQAPQEARRLHSWLRSHCQAQVHLVSLPAGLDPGVCPRNDFWKFVDSEIQRQQV